MITIDGSTGEGGGQILRSALALAVVTGQSFRLVDIRAKRSKPGLMRQHLTAVRAATAISNAKVAGDALGSRELTFEPSRTRGGEYHFAVGTAGSTTLVLQTVLVPLIVANERSRLVLEGGTHNPFAPPFEYLSRVFLPLVTRLGPRIDARLERHGFYPAGGGRLVVEIEPVRALGRLELDERGAIRRRSAVAMVSSLPRHIAERELKCIGKRYNWTAEALEVREIERGLGPGNVLLIEHECEHVTEIFTGFGEVQHTAERVASDAMDRYEHYLRGNGAAGEHLTDQLMLPIAVAGHGRFTSTGITPHAATHAELIQQFLKLKVAMERRERDTLVEIA
ncbi:MAG: RNA 3'-terminal phosphate cyclase [Planctomycetota bacterium]